MARILTTDPERRPSAREVLESFTVQEEPVSVTPTENNELLNKGLQNLSLEKNTKILVTSSGLSAEYQGERLGVYKKAGTHNNCPYYKQMDIERKDGEENVIYSHTDKRAGWVIGSGLDGSIGLKNESNTKSVPLSGWICHVGDYKFKDDPHLMTILSHDQAPACGEITITASGDVAVKQPECVGVYKPTQMFSRGRRVFKHQTRERYLLVPHGRIDWRVQDSVGGVEGARLVSGCAPSMCPADPRARTSKRTGLTSWIYFSGEGWRHGAITVKCSVHNPVCLYP